ncbi:MAG: hypothetical protein V3S20_08750 [Dehalococcoidia bacterium]
MAKRETTRWLYTQPFRNGTYIRVGRVHNAQNPPYDIIRYQAKSGSPDSDVDFYCTVDEAAALATGLMEAVSRELLEDSVHVRERYR